MRTRPVSGVRKIYNGIGIAGSMGSPVKAVGDGVVKTAVSNCQEGLQNCGGGYGNWIEIEHGNGRTTRYAHLREGERESQSWRSCFSRSGHRRTRQHWDNGRPSLAL